MVEIGENIKKLRKAKRMTQKAVEMYSLSKVAEKAPAADLILLTPEAQFALKELQEAVPHTPILLLSSQEYGLLPIEQIAEKSLQAML